MLLRPPPATIFYAGSSASNGYTRRQSLPLSRLKVGKARLSVDTNPSTSVELPGCIDTVPHRRDFERKQHSGARNGAGQLVRERFRDPERARSPTDYCKAYARKGFLHRRCVPSPCLYVGQSAWLQRNPSVPRSFGILLEPGGREEDAVPEVRAHRPEEDPARIHHLVFRLCHAHGRQAPRQCRCALDVVRLPAPRQHRPSVVSVSSDSAVPALPVSSQVLQPPAPWTIHDIVRDRRRVSHERPVPTESEPRVRGSVCRASVQLQHGLFRSGILSEGLRLHPHPIRQEAPVRSDRSSRLWRD